MQDCELKDAMELADRIWHAIQYEGRASRGRSEELELQLNVPGWMMLQSLYEKGNMVTIPRVPTDMLIFMGVPARMIPELKDAWRLVRIVARG